MSLVNDCILEPCTLAQKALQRDMWLLHKVFLW